MKRLVPVLVLALTLSLACSQGTTPPSKDAPVVKQAPSGSQAKVAPAPAKKLPAKPAKKPAPAKKAAAVELLANGSFEQWKDGIPVGWSISEKTGDDWGLAAAKQAAEAKLGKAALELPAPKGGDYVLASQRLNAKKVKPGKPIVVSAQVKSGKGNRVSVVLSYKQNGKVEKVHRSYTGKGNWQKLQWTVDVPKDAVPGSLKLEVFRFAGKAPQVLIDAVSVKAKG